MAAGDAATLASLIREATKTLDDPQAAAPVARAATEFVMQVPEHPAAAMAAMQVAGPQSPDTARFFAFRTLADVASKGKLQPQDPAVARLFLDLLDMLRHSTLAAGGDLATVPGFVREKYARALAAVVVYGVEWSYPAGLSGWKEVQWQITEAGQQSALHAALALTSFRAVAEILQSDVATHVPPQRRKAVSKCLVEAAPTLFGDVTVWVNGKFPNSLELDRSVVHLARELATIVPVSVFMKSAPLVQFLFAKVESSALRSDVLQAFADWVTKDIAKDFEEAPEETKQFLEKIFGLVRLCHAGPGDLTEEDPEVYDGHKGVAMLIRDFVEANKPSLDNHPELQEWGYQAGVCLMQYPSHIIRQEAATILQVVLKAKWEPCSACGEPLGAKSPLFCLKCGKPREPRGAKPRELPPWLQLETKLLPWLLLCLHKELPLHFPLPAGFQQQLEVTSKLDMEEDLSEVREGIKGHCISILYGLAASPYAIAQCLEFSHGVLTGIFQAPPGLNLATSFDAALLLLGRVMQGVKPAFGPQFATACGTLLRLALEAPGLSAKQELRRLEFLSKSSPALESVAQCIPGPPGAELVEGVFDHIFRFIEHGPRKLREKAIHSFSSICRAAPKAVQPVFGKVVQLAERLLGLLTIEQGKLLLCEPIVAALATTGNFELQRCQLRNLFEPIIRGWSELTDRLTHPEHFANALLSNRRDMEAVEQLLLCFEGCFRSGTAPADAAAAGAGGFTGAELRLRSPVGEIVQHVFPTLVALMWGFHRAFASDVTQPVAGMEALEPYRFALDAEELKCLKSSHDRKGKDSMEAFPVSPDQKPSRVHKGRHLLYLVRGHLYQCVGSALAAQDGSLTNPELPALLGPRLIECLEASHPYHVELQLRSIWMPLFGPTGMQAASEVLQQRLAQALLPRLLAALCDTLGRHWQWLHDPKGPSAANEDSLFAMCFGTIMASRTFGEFVGKLAAQGTITASEPLREALRLAVNRVICWPDDKSLVRALQALKTAGVRVMSGGEDVPALRDWHITSPEAPQRCAAVVDLVMQPLVELCRAPPAPPADGALHSVVGRRVAGFFSPEQKSGRVEPSPFASNVAAAMFPSLHGMCQVFVSRLGHLDGQPVDLQRVPEFRPLAEAFERLAGLSRVQQRDVQLTMATLLHPEADPKTKRGALRKLIGAAVDP